MDVLVKMGRPAKGIGSQFSEPVLSAIHQYRTAHQGWGAKTIRTELLLDGRFSQDFLPSLTTIANYLQSKGLVKIYEPNRPLTNAMLFNLTKAHQQWQIDDMGPESYPSVGFVGMINVKDVFSKVYIQTFPVTLEHTRSHPNMSDYQCALRLGFIEFGLPDAIQADHGSNFYENKSKSPFPTTLHLWLVALGIDFSWSRTHRPTDQGSVERSHWTTFNQIQRSQSFKNWQELKEFCDQRRYKLNHHLVCDTLKKAPLVAFPEAIHSKKYFNPLTEHLIIDLQKVFSFLAKGEWFRKVSSAKTISLAGQVYYLTNSKPNQKIRITFDSDSKELFFHDDNELFLKLPIKGISIEKLMGGMFEQIALPNVQLDIPFNWNQIKVSTTLLYSD